MNRLAENHNERGQWIQRSAKYLMLWQMTAARIGFVRAISNSKMRFTRRVVTGLVLAWAATVAASARAQQAGEDKYGIDTLFQRFAKPDTPGCAVGVLQNGRTIIE